MKTMRTFLMAMALMAATSTMWAQPGKQSDKKASHPSQTEMAEKRADRLIVEMQLSDADASKFKEIFLRHANAEAEKKARPTDEKQYKKAAPAERTTKTDGQIDEEIKTRMAQKIKSAQDESAYYNELRTVLSARQAQKVMGSQHAHKGFGQHGPQMGAQRKGFGQHGPQMDRPNRGIGQHSPMMGPQRRGFGQHAFNGGNKPGPQHRQQQGMHRQGFGQHGPQQNMEQHGPHKEMTKKEKKAMKKRMKKTKKEASKRAKKANK